MKLRAIFFVLVLALSFAGVIAKPARAADWCYCEPTAAATKAQANSNVNGTSGPLQDANCVPKDPQHECLEISDPNTACSPRDTLDNCTASVAQWKSKLAAQEKKISIVGMAIPSCLLDKNLGPDCRNLDVLVQLLINFARWAFTVIGAVALGVFVWGGFILILSQGNAEKVQSGFAILTAAVMGLFVAFMGYLLVKFVGDAIGIKDLYKLP